jgi:hypothetical protein
MMRNTTTWKYTGHDGINKGSRKMATGLASTEICTLMGMTANTPLGDWKAKVLYPALGELTSAYTDWEDPDDRTPKKTTRLCDAETVGVPLCESVAGMALWNPLLSNAQLETLGLSPRPELKPVKPARVMEVAPWYKFVNPPRIRCVVVEYGDAESDTKRKPDGQQGVEFKWLVVKEPLADVTLEDLSNSDFDTSSPFSRDFPDAQRGWYIYIAGRWENNRGLKGPFGPIIFWKIP